MTREWQPPFFLYLNRALTAPLIRDSSGSPRLPVLRNSAGARLECRLFRMRTCALPPCQDSVRSGMSQCLLYECLFKAPKAGFFACVLTSARGVAAKTAFGQVCQCLLYEYEGSIKAPCDMSVCLRANLSACLDMYLNRH